jgi:hypothetical protein
MALGFCGHVIHAKAFFRIIHAWAESRSSLNFAWALEPIKARYENTAIF